MILQMYTIGLLLKVLGRRGVRVSILMIGSRVLMSVFFWGLRRKLVGICLLLLMILSGFGS